MNVTLRPEVQAFAEEMELRLRASDEGGGWDGCTEGILMCWLLEEVSELAEALHWFQKADHLARAGHAGRVRRTAADVANYAMMIADVIRAAARGE